MGVGLPLYWGGWGSLGFTRCPQAKTVPGDPAERGAARGDRGLLLLGGVPEAGSKRAEGGVETPVYLRRLETVRNAEAWGSRAAGRPRLGGQVEPVAAALGRKTQRRGGRTRGVTSQGSLHWNLIFICPGFTLLFFLHIFENRILSRFNLFLLLIPRLNRASRLGRLLLYSNHSGFWKPAERRKR